MKKNDIYLFYYTNIFVLWIGDWSPKAQAELGWVVVGKSYPPLPHKKMNLSTSKYSTWIWNFHYSFY